MTAVLVAYAGFVLVAAELGRRAWIAVGRGDRARIVVAAWFLASALLGLWLCWNAELVVTHRLKLPLLVFPTSVLIGLTVRRLVPSPLALPDLAGVHATRLGFGAGYLALGLAGLTEARFAFVIGALELLWGASALVLARGLRRGAVGGRVLVLWNIAAMASLFFSAYGAVNWMLPWHGETGVSSPLGMLPTFVYLVLFPTHVRVFLELRRSRASAETSRRPAGNPQ